MDSIFTCGDCSINSAHPVFTSKDDYQKHRSACHDEAMPEQTVYSGVVGPESEEDEAAVRYVPVLRSCIAGLESAITRISEESADTRRRLEAAEDKIRILCSTDPIQSVIEMAAPSVNEETL